MLKGREMSREKSIFECRWDSCELYPKMESVM
jgi:hypothetical protein